MFKVYLLRSLSKADKTYVGQTIKPIAIRVAEHNKGLSKSTKTYIPWELIYFENFYCKNCTNQREKFLKSGTGYRLRKILLENYQKLV